MSLFRGATPGRKPRLKILYVACPQILYNALTHTFQSQLLLRHLIRALTIAGRYDEATKALRLYRELWDKARETDAKEVAKEMRELRTRAMREEAGRGEGKVDVEKEETSTREKTVDAGSADSTTAETDAPYAVDIDSDALFIETVVFGTRLLCRYFGERAADAVDLAKRAKTVFDEAKGDSLRQDGGKIEADLERSLGAALGARARQGGLSLFPPQIRQSLSWYNVPFRRSGCRPSHQTTLASARAPPPRHFVGSSRSDESIHPRVPLARTAAGGRGARPGARSSPTRSKLEGSVASPRAVRLGAEGHEGRARGARDGDRARGEGPDRRR